MQQNRDRVSGGGKKKHWKEDTKLNESNVNRNAICEWTPWWCNWRISRVWLW